MLLLLRFIQRLIRTLNSDGTPGQVAAGLALGAALGLTPLFNLYNLLILAAVFLLNVSFPAAMLGWMVFLVGGFVLDPAFDAIGSALLLQVQAFSPAWTALYNTPVVPLSSYNNTVVLGSIIGWITLSVPIFLLMRFLVTKYRETVLVRLRKTKLFQALKASKLYNLYRLFQPE